MFKSWVISGRIGEIGNDKGKFWGVLGRFLGMLLRETPRTYKVRMPNACSARSTCPRRSVALLPTAVLEMHNACTNTTIRCSTQLSTWQTYAVPCFYWLLAGPLITWNDDVMVCLLNSVQRPWRASHWPWRGSWDWISAKHAN